MRRAPHAVFSLGINFTKGSHLNILELRKILLVGYTLDAPEGAPMLNPDGTPMRAADCPIRMRLAFWIPQKQPFRRREVGTLEQYVRSVVAQRRAEQPGGGLVSSYSALGENRGANIEEYMREHGLHQHLVNMTEHPHAYTLVLGAAQYELDALRAGAIEEQIQDFTFPRQPSLEELRAEAMPHWERRTLASLGYLPNGAPEDHSPKLKVQFELV